MREVASSLGLTVEVDWQTKTIFNSFFSTVRVRIQCKDPTKIPRKRIFVFKQQIYPITFKPEGFDQVDNPDGGGPEQDGGVEELENDDDDLLNDEPKDNDPPPEGEQNGAQDASQTSGGSQNQSGAPAGGNSVRRALNFNDHMLGQKTGAFDCLQLLQAMELNENEDDDMEDQIESDSAHVTQDDDVTTQLPEGWIFEFQDKNRSQNLIGDSSGGATKGPVQDSQNIQFRQESTQANQAEPTEETVVLSTQPRKRWKRLSRQMNLKKQNERVPRLNGVLLSL
jgi:hypothetical protein